MLPTLEHGLEAVAIGVKNIGCVILWGVIQPGFWLTVINCTCGLLPQSEKYTPITTEAFEVRMARRAIGTVVVNHLVNAQWRQSCFIELDGAIYIRNRDEYMVKNGWIAVGAVL